MRMRALSIVFTVPLFWVASVCAEDEVKPNHFNRAPLKAKPYAELPLGAIKPEGWLQEQLKGMAKGMTGHLDELYPEVVGDRNGWLGGDGDGWERGPYWIDGALPLAYQIGDEALKQKVDRWVQWTLNNQREDGYIGPIPFETPPEPEPGLQRDRRRDWWPKMVMLKVLQQHYMATGDQRVLDCLTRYFRFQLKELPKTPLGHWSYWANRRGADNLLVVYWLYNITGDKFLLELGDILNEQTHPYTDIFLQREKLKRFRFGGESDHAFHCVNVAQGIKTPIIRYQADPNPRHLQAIKDAFADIEQTHGQPHGLYGGDEGMHGTGLTQGSELCAAVEMMFSLEKMLEITGDLDFADRLEMIAFNVLPTQVSEDSLTRQYYQQANQVMVTKSIRNFIQEREGRRIVFGLTSGYPCCTCNLHQGWPKLTQHLWMATADKGLAALIYAPSEVTATVADDQSVTLKQSTYYPFEDRVKIEVSTDSDVNFPLHLRVPSWCDSPTLSLNGESIQGQRKGNLLIVNRLWKDGDQIVLTLPMQLRTQRFHENSVSLYRGPLLYALEIEEEWSVNEDGDREARPKSPWNYALNENHISDLEKYFKVITTGDRTDHPWSLGSAPIRLKGVGVQHPAWKLYNESAGPIPWSPQPGQRIENIYDKLEYVSLVPYGCSTLRVSAFPTFKWIANKKPQ
jgi:DUF1680 family protein